MYLHVSVHKLPTQRCAAFDEVDVLTLSGVSLLPPWTRRAVYSAYDGHQADTGVDDSKTCKIGACTFLVPWNAKVLEV